MSKDEEIEQLFRLALNAVNNGNGYADRLRDVCNRYESEKNAEIERLRARVAQFEYAAREVIYYAKERGDYPVKRTGNKLFKERMQRAFSLLDYAIKAAPQQEQEG